MKKILFLIFTPNNSGAEFIIRNLIQKNNRIISYTLIDEKYQRKISGNDFKTKYIQKLNRNSHSIFSYWGKIVYLSTGLTFSIIKLQKKYKFDIIYANTLTMAAYGILSRVIFKIFYPNVEFIWHDHNINYISGKSELLVEKVCNSIYSKTIAVSRAVYNKNEKMNKNKFILYNGVDTNLFKENNFMRQKLRNQFSIKQKFVIGIFGQIMEEKGHIALLEVIDSLHNHYKDLITLVVIGEFYSKRTKQKFNETIKNLGLQNIILVHFISNIYMYYNLIDVLVNNTNIGLSESFGLTIIEGMASSKIVIAPQMSGPAEIIQNGIDGFLFKPENNNELIKKIDYVIKNYENLEYVRRNARKKILKKFTLEKMIISFNKIIYNY